MFTAALLAAACTPANQTTGHNSLFIGHSFFKPPAEAMPFHTSNAGLTDHAQQMVTAGNANGAPEALWNNNSKRAQIQGILDGGDIELFGMTYHYQYPGASGYVNWITYALDKNSDTKFFIAIPWWDFPSSVDAATYADTWRTEYAAGFPRLDWLRGQFPGTDIYAIPYGEAAVTLREMHDAGQLPEIGAMTGPQGLFTDNKGHPGPIVKELSALIWLRAIYGVQMSTYNYDHGYDADLLGIADAIMDAHNPAYNTAP